MPRTRSTLLKLLISISITGWVWLAGPLAPVALAQNFQTIAPYAILVDADTGTVLFEKNADELMVPASMNKLMTLAVIFHEIREGRLSMDSEFLISENAWRKGGGPSSGSSPSWGIGRSPQSSRSQPALPP